ncbi:hypothetical protein GLOIN_2v1880277 [Rhizophagus irregularis DAOM 181602=DAOM 197198]|uniref:PARP catalytic domain-containing protein n=1 Tax=Rhizophagus irregularis (strain DAOM 181602 / DAOM 197198 / MUCL 43194) TaxID=747089 RepID=A0A2P4PKH5_RHIID|nr:hypothetical protein GLOIN_2v1880277 [Rhizophagus irregularis DAOM 181602=DAOM 197198]POG65884.1 hypothetical protein GLOIN_2v1880277 [Rhizophagus irregularis DAOM 181602=DAOM 197198]|eukprot:XP_025172750.1 hypothetical protein GLOIN_2v1880277 [Rhizophagus irregularis DAOM 181602=DAOM 197198]
MKYNEGYLYGKRELERNSDYTMSHKFIKEYLQLDDSIFSHHDNCYYLENYSHLEYRGGHRYLRPSKCSKFVLKQGHHLFYNYQWTYSYHGTNSKNIKSILQHGLKIPGTLAGEQIVRMEHGSTYGNGIYTSKIPLYSQLYAPVIRWNGKYFQTILMVRQRSDSIDVQEGEANEMQYVCFDESSCILHALLVKVHDYDPMDSDGGEYRKISKILDNLK